LLRYSTLIFLGRLPSEVVIISIISDSELVP
jgi:hypothetical protein